MMPPPAIQKKVSFSELAFKGMLKYAFVTAILLAIISLATAAVLAPMAPRSYSGTIQNGEFGIDVKDTSEQPIDIIISHTYSLTVSYPHFTVDGDDYISFNVTIASKSGQLVLRKSSSLEVPESLDVNKYSSHATYTGTEKHWADMLPGSYVVTIESTAPLDYKVVQKFKYQGLSDGMLALGVLFLFILILLSIFVIRKRDAMNMSRTIAAMSGGAPPERPVYQPVALPPQPPPFYPPAQAPAPPPYYPPAQPQYYPPAQPPAPPPYTMYIPAAPPPPPPGTPDRSSLEYVPGGAYVDFVCLNCGRVVTNRPVNGIVTCGTCGQQSRIY